MSRSNPVQRGIAWGFVSLALSVQLASDGPTWQQMVRAESASRSPGCVGTRWSPTVLEETRRRRERLNEPVTGQPGRAAGAGDLAAAASIVDASVYRLGGFPPVRLPADLDWSEDPFGSRTWQWALHSLEPVRQLLAGFRHDSDVRYLVAAKRLAADWMADNLRVPAPCGLSWHDHATALRLRVLVDLMRHLPQLPDDDVFEHHLLRTILLHCRILALDSFYSRHSNHGLDQSLSLFVAAYVLGSQGWRSVALDRLRDEISFMFTSEGIHKENSPSYHVWVLDTVEQAVALVRRVEGVTILDPAIRQGMYDYLTYATLPNGELPLFGDSVRHRVAASAIPPDIAGRGRILFSLTQGRKGTPPDTADTAAVYTESGYAFFRSDWGTRGRFADAVHFSFKARNIATYHRQVDNLTFSLYGYGERWICDSGKYRYEPGDPFRTYMLGPSAHNVVLIDDGWRRRGRREDARITAWRRFPGGVHLSAICRYPGIGRHERDVVYLRPDTLWIRDLAVAEGRRRSHSFRLLLHVEPSKDVVWLGRTCLVRSSARPQRWLAIHPCGEEVADRGVIRGQTEPRVQGWVSFDGVTLEEAPVVYFDRYGQRAEFETLLVFGAGAPPGEDAWTSTARDLRAIAGGMRIDRDHR